MLLPAKADAVVDVGAGTGNLTRLLVQRVPKVTAVEPDPRMRGELTQRVPQARIEEGTAEALPLPDGSQDAVLASSAWHWVDPERAVPEAARVLRPGGRLAVVWTSPDREQEWVADLWRQIRPEVPGMRREARRRSLRLPDGAPFGPEEGPRALRFTHRFTREQLHGVAGTYSAVLTLPEQERHAFLERLQDTLASDERLSDPAGLEVPMVALCWHAQRI